jgi:transcriptional regulator with XRE-family HTH domain
MKTSVLNRPTLGSRIKFARQLAEMNQDELAVILDITKQQISCYENEKSIPPADKVLLIADTCKVDPGWLLSGRGNPF